LPNRLLLLRVLRRRIPALLFLLLFEGDLGVQLNQEGIEVCESRAKVLLTPARVEWSELPENLGEGEFLRD